MKAPLEDPQNERREMTLDALGLGGASLFLGPFGLLVLAVGLSLGLHRGQVLLMVGGAKDLEHGAGVV